MPGAALRISHPSNHDPGLHGTSSKNGQERYVKVPLESTQMMQLLDFASNCRNSTLELAPQRNTHSRSEVRNDETIMLTSNRSTAKSRTITVRLISMAMTGFYRTMIRPRAHRPLSMLKYDPVVKKKVLFLEATKGGKAK